jgi:hypothetical protein
LRVFHFGLAALDEIDAKRQSYGTMAECKKNSRRFGDSGKRQEIGISKF